MIFRVDCNFGPCICYFIGFSPYKIFIARKLPWMRNCLVLVSPTKESLTSTVNSPMYLVHEGDVVILPSSLTTYEL